jgi:hypothetical protein
LHAPDHVAGELIERNKLPIELANKNAATTDRDASVHGPQQSCKEPRTGRYDHKSSPFRAFNAYTASWPDVRYNIPRDSSGVDSSGPATPVWKIYAGASRGSVLSATPCSDA